MTEQEIPTVLPLKAFTPRPETARNEQLRYSDNLALETGKIIDETKRQMTISDAEKLGDMLKAESNKRQLLTSYLVYLAYRTNEGDSKIAQQMWADAFTKESINLYGEPNKELAENLIQNQMHTLLHSNGEPAKLDRLKVAAHKLGLSTELRKNTNEHDVNLFGFEKSRAAMGDYLSRTYSDVYEAMNIEAHEGLFTPGDIADTFTAGIAKLAERDASYSEWNVVRRDDKAMLSVEKADKEVIVGMQRPNSSAEQVKGLFAHEILRHMQTNINGQKIDEKLAAGLPNYLDFEEGAGVFHEYAITGKLKDELIDRYADIALALGYDNNGKHVPRSALLEYALAREEIRNDVRAEHEKLSEEDLRKKVYAHINRIYRGTPGTDEVVGVFTKDIAYLEGFLTVGTYLESELVAGRAIDEIMTYITQGKFDPTIPEHAAYIASLYEKKPSKELVPFIK